MKSQKSVPKLRGFYKVIINTIKTIINRTVSPNIICNIKYTYIHNEENYKIINYFVSFVMEGTKPSEAHAAAVFFL